MKRHAPLLAAAFALLLASCVDRPTAVDSSGELPSDLPQPALSVLDGTQEGGNEHFFWLPPLGDGKSGFEGVADPTQLPAVEICPLDSSTEDGCVEGQPLAARFTRTSGRDQDRIKVDDKDEYFVHWRMNDFPPQAGGQYRIRVMIQDTELGFADVVTLRQKQIRTYSGDLIAISDNGAFKIAFRIEEGALCSGGALGCTTATEIPGDGQPTVVEVPAQTVGGDQVVAAVVTVNDAVFEDENGDPIPDVTVSVAVKIGPPSDDIFLDDGLEIPFFVEIKTFPSDVYIDPNGPGVVVVICQDEDELDNRSIFEPLHPQLILYKVSQGTTKRLVSTFGAPECSGALPAPSPGLMGMLKRGAANVLGLFGPQPLVARRRLHGGLNTVVKRSTSDAEAFSTFGAALGPNADSSFAVFPAGGEVGTPVPITIQLRNAIGQNFLLAGDTLEVTVRGANPVAAFQVTNFVGGVYPTGYTPSSPGVDSVDIVLIRSDGVGLGPIGGSPYILSVTGPTAVTNANDAGPGSLRQAMINANASPGEDTITFSIPGGGPHVIALASALPDITEALVIDATTQPGYGGAPLVEINGSGYAAGPNAGHGFAIQVGNVTIRGMAITSQPRSGIFALQGTSNILIEDNRIGTDGAGSAGKGNATAGLRFRASNSRIRNNVISGNTQNGILLDLGAANDSIYGNIIGLSPTGTAPLPNGWDGITMFDGVSGTVVLNNTISGNGGWGIDIQHSGSLAQVTGTVIVGNVIGLDTNGDVLQTAPGDLMDGATNFGPIQRGNGSGGIRANNAPGTIIGGPGGANTISGNSGDGVTVIGPAVAPAAVIRGNFIGTNPGGSAERGNTANGVSAYSSGVAVGGPAPADRNIISGNISDGVETGGGATGVVIEGNYVGVDASGSAPMGNGLYYGPLEGCCHTGIFVRTGNNTVRGNVVSANWLGIRSGDVSGAANLIENNLVGTDAGGMANLGNLTDGIGLYGDKSGTQVRGNTIRFNGQGVVLVEGTENALVGGGFGEGNVISDNNGNGVQVGYDVLAGDARNTIRRNSIFDNGALGIDLAGNGITANDPLDADTGPNGLVNRPELLSATSASLTGEMVVQVRLDAMPATVYTIEYYASPTCDPSGAGEGRTPIVVAPAQATFGSGQITFTIYFGSSTPVGSFITATATDPDGNTSEFSDCRVVTEGARIRGSIVNDRDLDLNTVDPGEALAGATVRLSLGGQTLADVLTDAQGRYEFTGLRAGSPFVPNQYRVEVIATPAGTQAVRSPVLSLGDTVTVVVAVDGSTVGEFDPIPLPRWDYDNGTVSNRGLTHFTFLYDDGIARGKAVTAANAPVAGMTVVLRRCFTAAGASSPPAPGACTAYYTFGPPYSGAVSTTTDANGDFSFSGLLEGVYEVTPQPVTVGLTTSAPAQALYLLIGQADIEVSTFIIG